MVLFEAIVEFKYEANEPDELSLQVGQIVKVIAEVDEGWWQGDLNGKIGVFPSNFVKRMERAKAPALPVAAAVPVAVAVAAAPAAAGGSSRRVKVTHEYKANDEDELTLRVGDVITVLGEESEGWSKGEINGKFGTFPSNFAVEYKDDGEDQAPETKLKKIGVPTGGIGSLFGGGVPQLKKRNTVIDLKPAEPTPPPAQTMKKSPSFGGELKKESAAPPPVTPSPAAAAAVPAATLKIRKAKVTFPYEGADEDELSLTIGEVLVVIGEEGEGWWRGTNAQGTTGVFPNNFVEEFWDTIEAKSAPSKSARPPADAPKPAKPADPPKPVVASRLSRAEPTDPAPAPTPAVNKPKPAPVPAPAPAADTSATNTGSTRPASPPPVFEKKKFNTPVAAAKPAAAAEVDGELLKKLSVRNAASESDAPPPSKPEPAPVAVAAAAAAAPPPAAAKPSPAGLPPKPAPIVAAAKPAVTPLATAAPIPLVTVNENDSGDSIDSPSEDSPKLHHATKDRPKIGSNRRKPQRRSFSAGSGSLAEEEGSDKPAEPAAAKPQLPTRSAAPASTESEPKLPERPKLAGKPSVQPSADPHTLPELKDWFQQELAALKRELQEERTARKALEDRLAKLEGARR